MCYAIPSLVRSMTTLSSTRPPSRTYSRASRSTRSGKKNLHTRFCSVLCDTISDKDTLLNCGGIILPIRQISLFLTFALTADEIIRTSLPKEIRLVPRNHEALLYQGGMVLSVTSSIPAPPAYIF